jgi:hypothetical protein
MLTLLIVRQYGHHAIPLPVIDHRPHVQADYERRRRFGQSHRLAEMLASREAPMMKGSDRAFNEGRSNGNQFAGSRTKEMLGDYCRSVANRHGVSTTGKFYASQLAAYPGDPRAWVSDVSDAKQVAKERGMTLRGIVDYTPDEGDHSAADERTAKQFTTDKYRVADEVVEDEIFNRVADNPEMWRDLNAHPKKVEDLKEQISNQLSGH